MSEMAAQSASNGPTVQTASAPTKAIQKKAPVEEEEEEEEDDEPFVRPNLHKSGAVRFVPQEAPELKPAGPPTMQITGSSRMEHHHSTTRKVQTTTEITSSESGVQKSPPDVGQSQSSAIDPHPRAAPNEKIQENPQKMSFQNLQEPEKQTKLDESENEPAHFVSFHQQELKIVKQETPQQPQQLYHQQVISNAKGTGPTTVQIIQQAPQQQQYQQQKQMQQFQGISPQPEPYHAPITQTFILANPDEKTVILTQPGQRMQSPAHRQVQLQPSQQPVPYQQSIQSQFQRVQLREGPNQTPQTQGQFQQHQTRDYSQQQNLQSQQLQQNIQRQQTHPNYGHQQHQQYFAQQMPQQQQKVDSQKFAEEGAESSPRPALRQVMLTPAQTENKEILPNQTMQSFQTPSPGPGYRQERHESYKLTTKIAGDEAWIKEERAASGHVRGIPWSGKQIVGGRQKQWPPPEKEKIYVPYKSPVLEMTPQFRHPSQPHVPQQQPFAPNLERSYYQDQQWQPPQPQFSPIQPAQSTQGSRPMSPVSKTLVGSQEKSSQFHQQNQSDQFPYQYPGTDQSFAQYQPPAGPRPWHSPQQATQSTSTYGEYLEQPIQYNQQQMQQYFSPQQQWIQQQQLPPDGWSTVRYQQLPGGGANIVQQQQFHDQGVDPSSGRQFTRDVHAQRSYTATGPNVTRNWASPYQQQ